MNPQNTLSIRLLALATVVIFSAGLTTANADEPCPGDDFGECKVLIEINATDGDIGFHFLVDGDNLIRTVLFNPDHRKIFSYVARRELREQFVTETFAESAEPLCWLEPEAVAEAALEDEELEIVTLEDFLETWSAGPYHFFGIGEDWEFSHGVTVLTKAIPAAPDLECTGCGFDGSSISWDAGVDLGTCATEAELDDLVGEVVGEGDLPIHPKDVMVDAWEVVFEPDVEDDDPRGAFVYSVRVAGDISPMEVTVPADYLLSLGDDTPVKIEVGAIGGGDNATFTEIFDICVNEVDDNLNDNLDGCGFAIGPEVP